MTAPATPEDATQRWSLLFETGEPHGRRRAACGLSLVVGLAPVLGLFGAAGFGVCLDPAGPPGVPRAKDFEVTVSRRRASSSTAPAFGVDELVPAGRPPTDTIVGVLQV